MEAGGSVIHSEKLSNNLYPKPNQFIDTYLFKIFSSIVFQSSQHSIYQFLVRWFLLS